MLSMASVCSVSRPCMCDGTSVKVSSLLHTVVRAQGTPALDLNDRACLNKLLSMQTPLHTRVVADGVKMHTFQDAVRRDQCASLSLHDRVLWLCLWSLAMW
jgi:hypothetical protein